MLPKLLNIQQGLMVTTVVSEPVGIIIVCKHLFYDQQYIR